MATQQIPYAEGDPSSTVTLLEGSGQTAVFTSDDWTGADKFSSATFEFDATEDAAGTMNVYVQRKLPSGDYMDIAAVAITVTSKPTIDFISAGSTVTTSITDGLLAVNTAVSCMMGKIHRIKAEPTSGTWTLTVRGTYYP